ncbi:MAG: YetF domain-containing protein [Caulobacteraceae bacterium]
MLIVFVRTIILYIVIVVTLRLLGKRQIGQLQPSELVVALVVADLASVPMSNVGVPLINGIIPIITLFILEELLSYIALKSEKARGVICGLPSILVEKGVIVEDELKRIRYNINDLLEQLRLMNFFNVEDVEYAILETSGKLSVIPKPEKAPLTPKDFNLQPKGEGLPVTVIIDGRINSENLGKVGLNDDWLYEELRKNNISSAKEVFFAFLAAGNQLRYQLKGKPGKRESIKGSGGK